MGWGRMGIEMGIERRREHTQRTHARRNTTASAWHMPRPAALYGGQCLLTCAVIAALCGDSAKRASLVARPFSSDLSQR